MLIRDLSKCDFTEIDAYFKKCSEDKRSRSKEEDKDKATKAVLIEDYGFCTMDGHREKIGNFRTEPPHFSVAALHQEASGEVPLGN